MTDSIASSTATSNEHAHTHSRSEHETTADIFRDYLRQFRAHGAISTIDDGEGDDVINSDQWHARIYGGEGDDVINSTGYDVDVYGGSGDDIINVQGGHVGFVPHVHVHVPHGPWQGHCVAAVPVVPVYYSPPCASHMLMLMPSAVGTNSAVGGEGDDTINASGFIHARGEQGDDTINMIGGIAYGGTGDDTINSVGGSAIINGESGDDKISLVGTTNINSYVSGGAGDDEIFASGSHLTLMGGTGNDQLTLDGTHDLGGVRNVLTGEFTRTLSTLQGGLDDDEYLLTNGASALIEYYEGDGHDTIVGADEGSVLKLFGDITADNTGFSIADNDLILSFAQSEGSITIKDYAASGIPTIEFSDGRLFDASTTIAKAGGDPDAYAPNEESGTSATESEETND